MQPTRDASSPIIWPPIIYTSATVISGMLAWLIPWPFAFGEMWMVCCGVGIIAGLLGVLMLVLAGRSFTQANTPIAPNLPTKALVFDGVYAFTRNPMYVAFTLILMAFGLYFNQLWFLIAAPIAMFAVTKLAIQREEAYLEAKFGADYVGYKARVRRWV